MASSRMARKEERRARLAKKYEQQRKVLRQRLNDPTLDMDEKMEVLKAFSKMPRDSAKVRLRRRCRLTGRPRGIVYDICRHKFREHASAGECPGVVKSSW